VRRYADAAAAEFGLERGDRHEFVFAVNEAVTNAIKHGRPDRDGTIGLCIDTDGDTLICSVSDSGQFLPAPADSDPLPERGRGLNCMALMMDEIELSTAPDGTTVRLHKRRVTEAAEPAA
jgi:anti-sigma regulatory factor (Ser/Thr protein kinase)